MSWPPCISMVSALTGGAVALAVTLTGCGGGGSSATNTTGAAHQGNPEQVLATCFQKHHYSVSRYKNPDSVLLRVTSDGRQSVYVWLFQSKKLADAYVKPLKLPYIQSGTRVAAYPPNVNPAFRANVARCVRAGTH